MTAGILSRPSMLERFNATHPGNKLVTSRQNDGVKQPNRFDAVAQFREVAHVLANAVLDLDIA
jgi:hypothetical protein